jgi:hypothetical protein
MFFTSLLFLDCDNDAAPGYENMGMHELIEKRRERTYVSKSMAA